MSDIHLVTGGAGFLGQLIIKRLLDKGFEVRSFDLLQASGLPENVEQVVGSVCDREQVAAVMKGVTNLHHNAAMVPITRSMKGYTEVNHHGSRIVMEEAAKAGIKRTYYISTSAIFDQRVDPPYDESTPLVPSEPYGISKLAGEQVLRKICAESNSKLTVMRPRTLLGHNRSGILGLFFNWMREDIPIPIVGKGSNLFQFLHVDDLLDFYMLAMEKDIEGNFNVGCEEYGSLGGDLQATAEAVGSKSRIVHLPKAPAIAMLSMLDFFNLMSLTKWHYRFLHRPFFFDIQPLLDLGWKPRYSNLDMLIEGYQEHKERQFSGKESVHRRPAEEKALAAVKWAMKTFW